MDRFVGFGPGGDGAEGEAGDVAYGLTRYLYQRARRVVWFDVAVSYKRIERLAVELGRVGEQVGFSVGESVGMEIDVLVLGQGDVVGGLGKEVVEE